MKKAFLIFMIFASSKSFSQIHFKVGSLDENKTIVLKSDTLFIPTGSCKFIKIGDKIYELKTSIEEVKPQEDHGIFIQRGFSSPYLTPATSNLKLQDDQN